MDYDFQPVSSRTERDEYRSRFKFTDEDKPARRSASSSKTKTDYLIRLILLQCALCIIIVSGIFIASKISPASFEKMKSDFTEIMQKNMTVGEMLEQVKGVADYVSAPVDNLPAMGKNIESGTEIAEIKEGYSVDYIEVTSDETGESVAVGEIEADGAGGGDIEKHEAAKGTSFAPYFVSVDPVIPVENARITSKFGYRTNPVSGNYGFHTGIDLAVAEGTPVSASFYGRVIETGESDVWGKYVLMEHSENLCTYYCHLSEIYVKENAVIRQGETIGLVGSTGWSTGPHLHFEVRINDIRVNPETLLYGEKDEG